MITGALLRDCIISGANSIANHRSQVDELNVFPVPDGDTGTNMSMTIGAARRDLENLPDTCTVDQAANVTAGSMLRGARGNSGVISSLLFRGFAKTLAGRQEASAQDIAAAFTNGVSAAYKAVMKPTEGTILTVARVGAEAGAACTSDDPLVMFETILAASKDALAKTPEQLPVLKKAGVVDAGGAGFVTILEGMLSVLRDGIIIEEQAAEKTGKVSSSAAGKGVFADDLMKVEDIKNGYCTQFLVNKKPDASCAKLRAFLESNGDSVVCVEDEEVINCHVHSSDPGRIISFALDFGYLTNFKIENMHEQFLARQAQGKSLEKQAEAESSPVKQKFQYAAVDPSCRFGFVAVAAGDGLRDIFRDIGVNVVVSGGQTMNPSTEDILEAAQSVPAGTVFVLPNNKNIIMAAEQSARLADRRVVVLPTRTIPQGITAMLNFDDTLSADENTIAMTRAADKVQTGSVTFAARDSDFDGHKIRQGEIMALENGKISFLDRDASHAAVKLARSMVKKDSSFVTVISGCDITEEEAARVAAQIQEKMPSGVEVTHLVGGQPVYYFLISIE